MGKVVQSLMDKSLDGLELGANFSHRKSRDRTVQVYDTNPLRIILTMMMMMMMMMMMTMMMMMMTAVMMM